MSNMLEISKEKNVKMMQRGTKTRKTLKRIKITPPPIKQ